MADRSAPVALPTEYAVLVAAAPELLNALPAGLIVLDDQGKPVRCNEEARRMWGLPARVEEIPQGWPGTRLLQPDGSPISMSEDPLAAVLQATDAVRSTELLAERLDGSRFTVLLSVRSLVDQQGTVVGKVCCCHDVSGATDRQVDPQGTAPARDVNGPNRLHLQRLAAIVEFSDDAIISKDANGIILTWNKGAERIFGYTAEEVVGRPVNILIPPDRQDEEPAILARIRRGEAIDHYETVRMRKDGSLLDISLAVSPLKDETGRVAGASKIARDVTERRRQEERRSVMMHELNHRVKNTLATVQSLAAQSFRRSSRASEFRQFEGRLLAVARVHDLLSRHDWGGVGLRPLVERILCPICVDAKRIELEGPPLRLPPKIALALALAFHELGTNAMEHGALSSEKGRIKLQWRFTESDVKSGFQLRWKETGGPKVKPPKTRGFGSLFLERVLSSELKGRTSLSFAPGGVTYEIAAPADVIMDGSETPGQ
jgi:PAS domain S-box-containing protein